MFVSSRIRSDIIGSDRIGYPHAWVGSDTGFGSDTPKSISNPYPFKIIGFYPYPYPYPLSSQWIFLLVDRIGSGRKSTDTDTVSISMHYALCTMHLYVFICIYYFIRIHTYLLFHMEIRRNPVILVLTRRSRRVE